MYSFSLKPLRKKIPYEIDYLKQLIAQQRQIVINNYRANILKNINNEKTNLKEDSIFIVNKPSESLEEPTNIEEFNVVTKKFIEVLIESHYNENSNEDFNEKNKDGISLIIEEPIVEFDNIYEENISTDLTNENGNENI